MSVYRSFSVWPGNLLAITGLSALITSRVKIVDECWKSRLLIRKSVNLPGSTKSTVTTAGAEGAEAAEGETARSLAVVQPKLPKTRPIAQIAQNVGFIAIELFKI
jgi:hypothetical protein